MRNESDHPWENLQEKWLSRRGLIRGAAGAIAGAALFPTRPVLADDDDHGDEHGSCSLLTPIPGGVKPFLPFGVFVHHNPLNPANAMAVAGINDPSQINDFDGFVGLTHIRGGGVGTNTDTGATATLGFQADMGFGQGKFIGIDGRRHEGTFAFV